MLKCATHLGYNFRADENKADLVGGWGREPVTDGWGIGTQDDNLGMPGHEGGIDTLDDSGPTDPEGCLGLAAWWGRAVDEGLSVLPDGSLGF